MIEITVKTIDGQNRSYSVPDDYTVKQFKEKISNSLSIPIDRQRLIFQGRELKDDKSLNEFDVNGKTVHLVQRIPPPINQPGAQNEQANANQQQQQQQQQHRGGIRIEHPNGLQNFVQQILSGIGDLGHGIDPNANAANRNIDVQIDLSNMANTMNDPEIRSRIRMIRRLLTLAESRLNRLQEIQSGAPLNDNQPFNFNIRRPASESRLSQMDNDSLGSGSNRTDITNDSGTSNRSDTTINSNESANTQQTSSSSSSTSQQQQQQQQQRPNTNVEVMADVINSVMDVYSRFQPYFVDYHRLLIEDAPEPVESETGENRRQRFCNNINDMMHLLGHLFHNLSDLHINLRERPPRNIRLMTPVQAAFVTATPIEANIHIPVTISTTVSPPLRTSASNTTAIASTTSTTTTSNNTASNQQPPTNATESTTQSQPPQQQQEQPLIDTNRLAGAGADQRSNTSTPTVNISTQPLTYFEYSPNTHTLTYNQISAHITTADDSMSDASSGNSGSSNNSASTSSGPTPPTTTTSEQTIPQPQPPQAQQQQQQQPQLNPFDPASASIFSGVQQMLSNIFAGLPGLNPPPAPPMPPTQNTTTTTTTTTTTIQHPPAPPQPTQTQSTNTSRTQRVDHNQPHVHVRNPFANNHATTPPLSNYDPYLPCNSIHFLNGNIIPHNEQNLSQIPRFIGINSHQTQRRRHPAGNQTNHPAPPPNNPLLINQQQVPRPPNPNQIPNLILSTLETGTDATEEDRITSALVRQTLQAINSNDPNNPQLQQPLSEILNSISRQFGNVNLQQQQNSSNSISYNLFNCIFSSMPLGSMFNLAFGENLSQVFVQSRPALRTYITNELLRGETLNETNKKALVERIYRDFRRDLELNFDDYQLIDPNVDLERSFERLITHHLNLYIDHIYSDSDVITEWSMKFYEMFKTMRDQVFILIRSTIRNADEAIIGFISRKIENMISGRTAAVLRNIFNSFTRQQLTEMLANIRLDKKSIEKFLVYKQQSQPQPQPPQPVTQSTISTQNTQQQQASGSKQSTPIVKPKTEKVEPIEVDDTTHVLQSILPLDWLPIIRRDISIMKEQKQTPLSDAYLSGMPAKRRKLVPKVDVHGDSIMRTVLKRTMSQINTKNDAKLDEVLDKATQSEFSKAFFHAFDTVLAKRLKEDPNFNTNQTSSSITSINSSTTATASSSASNATNKSNSNEKNEKYSYTKKRLHFKD